MKKALMLASVASMIDQFNMDNINLLQSLNYQVDVACNFNYGSSTSQVRVEIFKEELVQKDITPYHMPIPRGIGKFKEIIKSYKLVKGLVAKNSYDIVHCHSPIGGVIARLACRNARKKGTKVIYTAHGFHFYKGAPLLNWLVYYPVERWLARYTDVLITINTEDYNCAKNKFAAKRVEYVPGVGVDINKFQNVQVDKEEKRNSVGVNIDNFMIISVGEINKNKNHQVIIKAISKIKNKNIKYVICGQGYLENKLKKLVQKLNIEQQVKFLGFRKDVIEICKASDVFVFPSYREGLSVALMEAMACGVPVICSEIRGNIDLIVNGKGGYLAMPRDVNEFSKKIQTLYNDHELCVKMGKYNISTMDKYDIKDIKKVMKSIYE